MTYIDPTQVAPNNYKLLHEDDAVRVLEMSLRAGEKDVEHSHPNEVVYFISGGNLKIHLPGGETMDAEIPDGFVLPHEPWTHTVENTGTSDVKAIIFERK